mgnify:CR=1 FL=1|tara:strand:+ start:15005 stop:15961 length:957 start_codon:yes stop_codon:yes gene_type:complete
MYNNGGAGPGTCSPEEESVSVNLSKIDLNLLVTLQALLSERNVTHAAKRLRLSQPTVSAALGRLREVFNDPLLVRVGRGYELTPLATILQPELGDVIAALEDLFVARQAEGEQRIFRIAARDYMTSLLLPSLVRQIEKVSPQTTLCFSRVDSDSLGKLAAGQLDFVIMPQLADHSFPSKVLFEDGWICAACSGNKKVGKVISEEAYLAAEHLIFLPGPGKRIANSPRVNKTSTKRIARVAVDDFALIPPMLKGTELLAVLPERFAHSIQKSARLKLLSVPYEMAPLVQTVSWNPRNSHNPSHQWLIEQISSVLESSVT